MSSEDSNLKKLFAYKEIEILLDLEMLFSLNGTLSENITSQKNLGRFGITFTAILYILAIFLLLLQGRFTLSNLLDPKSLTQILLYILVVPLLLSLYLLRDRKSVSFVKRDLFDINKVFIISKGDRRIEHLVINDLIDFETSLLLNKVYLNKNGYIYYLFSQLAKDSRFIKILNKRLGLNPSDLLKRFDLEHNSKIHFDDDLTNFFSRLLTEAIYLKDSQVNIYTLFFVLIKYYLRDTLIDYKISDIEVEGVKNWYRNSKQRMNYEKRWKLLSRLKPIGDVNATYTSSITPTLDLFSDDLTGTSRNREFIISIGRDKELFKIISQLESTTSSFTYLVGEDGIGKKRLLKNLATRMVCEDVPNVLKDSRLINIDFLSLVSKTKSLDEIKANLTKIFSEVQRSGNIILIAENFTSLFSFRSEIKSEAVSLMKALLNTNIKLIAVDSTFNFTKFIKPDIELVSKFNVIEISEVEPQIALQILADEALIKEKKYEIDIYFSALKRITDYAYKFDYEKRMPQKGIDILEESILLAKSKSLNYLDASIVEEVLHSKIGVSVWSLNEVDKDKLLKLEDNLKSRVIGQDEAVNAVVSAIKRSRSGLINKNRPIASFLFYGPTGVGKTELAKALADLYYGSESMIVRLNMSEYQEESNLYRIIGGYNSDGSFSKGFLTESVRSKPFTLILLDEIEKANPKVLDLFLSVLDDGFLNDGMDRRVVFENTIIIMTSNVGSREIQQAYQQNKSLEEIKAISVEVLNKHYRPEFLNRFDKLIMFKHLNIVEVSIIIEKFMYGINDKLLERDIEIKWNSRTLEELAHIGYNPVWGARELRRVVQEKIEDLLADQIISGNIKDGDQIYLDGLKISKII